ncbi:MAG: pantoate--beta-alanine ligase, partial [Opitutales bacterium]|nr:pantoate--beta-alanine ligase [Opitutales bacterium]
VRESDGFALSSRNQYLSAEERAAAPGIHAALCEISEKIAAGTESAEALAEFFMNKLGTDPIFEPEYIEIVDNTTMLPLKKIARGSTLIAVAVRMTQSRTRLIDNIVV